jgi:hypothetical protein
MAKDEPSKITVKTPTTTQDRYPPLPGVKSITPTTGENTSALALPSAGRKAASPLPFVPKIVRPEVPDVDDKAGGSIAREEDGTCHDGLIEGEMTFLHTLHTHCLDELLLVVFMLWSDGDSFRHQPEAIMGFHITAFRIQDASLHAAFPLLKVKSSLTVCHILKS